MSNYDVEALNPLSSSCTTVDFGDGAFNYYSVGGLKKLSSPEHRLPFLRLCPRGPSVWLYAALPLGRAFGNSIVSSAFIFASASSMIHMCEL